MHEAIDIIRGKADQDYLDQIACHCTGQHENENTTSGVQNKSLIYLDRNNTPDVWAHISKTID